MDSWGPLSWALTLQLDEWVCVGDIRVGGAVAVAVEVVAAGQLAV